MTIAATAALWLCIVIGLCGLVVALIVTSEYTLNRIAKHYELIRMWRHFVLALRKVPIAERRLPSEVELAADQRVQDLASQLSSVSSALNRVDEWMIEGRHELALDVLDEHYGRKSGSR